ncbi:MAG: DUF5988 family protein [Actinoplanes sp.]
MSGAVRGDTSEEMPVVLLRGGPYPTPTSVRIPRQAFLEGKVKLARDGGYDHFERVPGGSPGDGETFQWITRTRVAE